MSLDIDIKYMDEVTHWQNITHNLAEMADEAGIYNILWRPEENDIKVAAQLIFPLNDAINAMKENPARFSAHNADNGWGTYKDFLPWLEELLAVCIEHPDGKVSASR